MVTHCRLAHRKPKRALRGLAFAVFPLLGLPLLGFCGQPTVDLPEIPQICVSMLVVHNPEVNWIT